MAHANGVIMALFMPFLRSSFHRINENPMKIGASGVKVMYSGPATLRYFVAMACCVINQSPEINRLVSIKLRRGAVCIKHAMLRLRLKIYLRDNKPARAYHLGGWPLTMGDGMRMRHAHGGANGGASCRLCSVSNVAKKHRLPRPNNRRRAARREKQNHGHAAPQRSIEASASCAKP